MTIHLSSERCALNLIVVQSSSDTIERVVDAVESFAHVSFKLFKVTLDAVEAKSMTIEQS